MRLAARSRLLASALALGAAGMVVAMAQGCTSFQSESPPASALDSSSDDEPTPTHDPASVDAADAADADAGPFCQRFAVTPRLCADFENGRAASATFPINLSSGGTVEVTDGGFESTFALRAAGATPAVLAREFGSPLPNEQSLSFRIRLPLGAGYARATRLVILTQAGDEACNFDFSFSDHLAALSYGAANAITSTPLAGHPGNGAWFHVAVALTVVAVDGGGVVHAAVSIDGNNALPDATVATNCTSSIFAAGRQRIEVGAQSMNLPTEIFFDDIVFDGK